MKCISLLAAIRKCLVRWQARARSAGGLLQLSAVVAVTATGLAHAQLIRPFPENFPDFVQVGELRAWPLPDGRTLYAGGVAQARYWTHALGVVRINPDGSPDRGFGTNGLVKLTVWGMSEFAREIVGLPDGKLLVGGNVEDPSSYHLDCAYDRSCNTYVALFRLNHDGSVDSSFNGTGRQVFHIGPAYPGSDDIDEVYLHHVTVEADGAALISAQTDNGNRDSGPVVARILADGTLDAAFIPIGTKKLPRQATFTVAVQFYNQNLDQSFVTADVDEIANLNRDEKSGWTHSTGGFRVVPAGTETASTVPVCRFYGRPEAGFDSHMLSASADECAALEAAGDAAWILESREVFRVGLPDPVTGACAPGWAPIYRLWNGRRDSGHVFTSDRDFRDNWRRYSNFVAEGWGPFGVAMCGSP